VYLTSAFDIDVLAALEGIGLGRNGIAATGVPLIVVSFDKRSLSVCREMSGVVCFPVSRAVVSLLFLSRNRLTTSCALFLASLSGGFGFGGVSVLLPRKLRLLNNEVHDTFRRESYWKNILCFLTIVVGLEIDAEDANKCPQLLQTPIRTGCLIQIVKSKCQFLSSV